METSAEHHSTTSLSWLTAVALASGSELQILCDGNVWVHDHDSFQDAIAYAEHNELILSEQGLEVLNLFEPTFWTTKIEVSPDTLRALGFRLSSPVHLKRPLPFHKNFPDA